jgi:integrase
VTRLGRALGPGTLKRVQRGVGGQSLWVLDFKDGTGRRRREALSPDRRVAERMRAQLISQRDLERAGLGTIEGQSMPLAELRDSYLADLEARVGAMQYRNVRDALSRVLGAVRAQRVRDLRVIDVMRHRNDRLRAGVSNRTANADAAAMRALLNWGVAVQLIAENPLRGLKPLPMGEKNLRRVRRALSDDEIAKFLAAADEDDAECAARKSAERTIEHHTRGRAYAKRHRTPRVPQRILWQALIETGARWGELTRATWADLDVERRGLTLRAETTKSGRTRVVPLREALVAELLALRVVHRRVRRKVVQADDRVMLTPDGADHDRATTGMRRLFRRVLDRAGIDRVDAHGRAIDIHALRHTAASRMARHGVPLVVAQKVLGHASPDMTARVYTHLEVDDLREAVEFGARAPRIVRATAGAASASAPDKLEQSA